jgi:hypothetical protein
VKVGCLSSTHGTPCKQCSIAGSLMPACAELWGAQWLDTMLWLLSLAGH